MIKNNQEFAFAFEQVHNTSSTKLAAKASDEELKEMRRRKLVAGLQRSYGGRVNRLKIGGSAREIS